MARICPETDRDHAILDAPTDEPRQQSRANIESYSVSADDKRGKPQPLFFCFRGKQYFFPDHLLLV
ncbi:MAG: hypothetical protein CMM01_16040 [Rhodopirellula sp.]|nr:hypothetical protein [Rhodopirellula sp.]